MHSQLNHSPLDNIKDLELLQLSMAILSYAASSQSPLHLVLEQVGSLLRACMAPARLECVFWYRNEHI